VFILDVKKAVIGLVLLVAGPVSASKLTTAFDALARYDYFKAKDLFYSINNKRADPYASYGLATIYSRNDNPFHNLDSAVKYVNLGYAAWKEKPEDKVFGSFQVDPASYKSLSDTVSVRMLRSATNINTIESFEHFLSHCYLADQKLRQAATDDRDALEFKNMQQVNTSKASADFLISFPESVLYRECFALYERLLFDEATAPKTAQSYLAFLVSHPDNKMVNVAYDKLFAIYRDKKDSKGMALFVTRFPSAPQNLEAWKLLFSWSAKSYTYAELKRFLDKYPEFPLKNSILHELELNKLVLYPFTKGDQVGFIDENGSMKIAPAYDAAGPFTEGLSLVVKGDETWFINKENVNAFGRNYEEAGTYRNGLAPVKIEGSWYFINRLGQVISKPFEEINELHDNAYVVKRNGQNGAVDQFGQTLIEPRFEKLGDLRNDIGYYQLNGKYGFVSPDGYTHPAEFDWLSDFSEFGQAVFKLNNKFGLTDRSGERVLPPDYDQILRQNDSVYLLVQNDLYGFYHAKGCMLHAINNETVPGIQSGKFTDGEFFKLHRKKQQAIANTNGNLLIPFGAYEEVDLPSEGLMRVKKKGKVGYADIKGSLLIQCKYEQGGEFQNKVAIVKNKEKFILLHHSGNELYADAEPISRLGKNHYRAGEGPTRIINGQGAVMFGDAVNIQEVAEGIFAFERENGEIRLIYD
jgi:hypothetical protein